MPLAGNKQTVIGHHISPSVDDAASDNPRTHPINLCPAITGATGRQVAAAASSSSASQGCRLVSYVMGRVDRQQQSIAATSNRQASPG